MEIFKNRYQAKKALHDDKEVIVKVDGGYTIMSNEEYHVWKLQK